MKSFSNLIQRIKQTTLIEWMVILILIGIVFGGAASYQSDVKINPLFRPREAQAQAMQRQNELKEQELELMKENNRLLRELKNK